MAGAQVAETVTLDRLDEQIIRALQLAPRAPFSRIADALEVSEQTVARRYRSLRRGGVLRVVAVIDPSALGESDWIVRIRARPEATLDLGRALAQRADIAWVSVGAGGSELVIAVRSHSQEQRERLLLDRLPRSAAVLEIAASVILRRFVGGSASDWLGLEDVLTAAQAEAITQGEPARRRPEGRFALTAGDYALFDVLRHDGRAPVSALAEAAELTQGRTARRLEALLRSGVLYLDVDVAPGALGYPNSAYLWLTVPPAQLESACTGLMHHREAPFVAAVSGRSNVIVSITCRTLDDVYRYVTEQVGAVDGVQSVEVWPVLRRIKQAGTLRDGDRLAAV
jgi:DNA-binding Lrp family transcriptional regulator